MLKIIYTYMGSDYDGHLIGDYPDNRVEIYIPSISVFNIIEKKDSPHIKILKD